jgi:hypothetical protein
LGPKPLLSKSRKTKSDNVKKEGRSGSSDCLFFEGIGKENYLFLCLIAFFSFLYLCFLIFLRRFLTTLPMNIITSARI